ncbi:MAG: Ig-like domain-containing protein [Bacteroidota bacterium]
MTRGPRNLVLFVLFFIQLSNLSAQLPTGFASSVLQTGYTAPMGVIFSNNGNTMWTWEKSGKVYVSKWNGTSYTKQATPVTDISDEVGDWRDFGLLSFCVDPDFETNGLVYLYYVVDRHHLLFSGTAQYNPATDDYFKATIGRVTRYRLNQGTTVTTDYTSRKILIGESITTGIPLLHESHMGGTLLFGRDKTLLLSAGDGSSYASQDVGSASETYYQQALSDGIIRSQENVGAFRAQMVNSMNGKILRFDPNTGNGVSSNPFYDAANPRSPKSRVWTLGFRNPFRMSMMPNTGSTNAADGNPGTLLVGDVGWNTWEELEVIPTGGLNCGWPLYEGEIATSYLSATTVNQDEGQPFKNLCVQPASFTIDAAVANRRFTHYRPAAAWKHGVDDARVASFNGTTPTDPQVGASGSPTSGQVFAGNCSVGGVYYTGTVFGAGYQNKLFFGDYGTNFIKVASLNAAQPWFSSISNFAPANFANGIVDMEQNPLDNSVLYVNINSGEIMRISMGGSQPPVAAISSNKIYGASPLTVNFSSAGSVDPDGGGLTYLWDFGDGTTSTQANPAHTYSGTGVKSFTVTLTVTDPASLTSSKSMIISLNNTPPVAKITNPVNNSMYSIQNPTSMQLAATVTDNETTTGMQYGWEVVLRHSNHEHREPVVNAVSPTVQISPIGCDGNTYYYMIQLTVTDNGNLVSADSVKIYPDCSTAGLPITNLVATPQNGSVVLSWINPTIPFDEIMVAAKPSASFLTNPSGTNYVADADYNGSGTAFEGGKIVYKGTGQGVTVTNLVAGTTYYFRVFTRKGTSWTGGVETSAAPGGTGGSNLTGSGVASTAAVNLTTEGTSDWAHWPNYDHKSAGGSKISNYTIIGGSAVYIYNDAPRSCTWSDGTPTASGTSNVSGVFVGGIGQGLQITAPADQTQRTLKMYVGGWNSGGTLTATLSDGSSPDYVNTSFSSTTGQYSAVYTLTYKTASAGKLLTVKWVQSSGTGNVTFQAATLVQSTATTVNVTGVTVSPASASIAVNGTQQLTATIAPANATNQNVSWSSSNTAIATVSASGLVTAVAAGTATITVTTQDGAKTATSAITVTTGTINVSGVTVGPASASIAVNGTQQLTATIAPANATNKNVSWSSSNTAIATVSASGLVTAVAAGTATITVTSQDGAKTATSAITVTTVSPGGSLSGSGVASTAAINLTTEGTSDWAHWPNYDHKSAGGSKISNYTIIGGSAVYIYNDAPRSCTWSDGTPTASGTSNVSGVFVGGIGQGLQITAPADQTQRTLKMYVGGWNSGGTLTATLSDGSSPDYVNTSFSSTTGQYSAVYTLTYKAAAAGKLLTVKWVQSSGTGNVTFQAATLVQSTATTVNVTGVTVSPASASIAVNGTQQLTATIAPANATNQNVSWSSNNTAIATVSASGLVTAVAAGTATITATTQDGAKTATSAITVTTGTINVTGLTVSPTSASIAVNGTQQLTATIAPANATNQNVSWNSSNTAIATVSASGLVTAVAAGTATITVTTQDGAKTATSAITVTATIINVTGVTVSPASASIAVNGTQQLTATIAPANATNKNVTWSSNNTAIATVSANGLVTGIAAGTATITATTQDGAKTATSAITVTTVSPGGSLSGSGIASTAAVNLTTEGTSDWAHWPNYDHKSTGGSKISNYTIIGGSAVYIYNDAPRSCTWSDGTPTASGTSNVSGVFVGGIGQGLQITAPADQTQRTLKMYVGGWSSGGTLTATLSDGSSPDYVNTSFSSATGQYVAVYTLTYKAASAGKLLTVKWVQSSGTGNVTLQAATLTINAARTMISNAVIPGIDSAVFNKSLEIYPNPFTDNLVIKYSGNEIGRGRINLYTYEMRLIGTYPFEKTAWKINQRINPKGLTDGIYIVEFQVGNTKIVRKLVRFR